MPRPDADRNLLFAILALQMDFITRDALIAGMTAWTLAKNRPIGEILVEAGALDSADRDLLEPMVDRHVDRHGGDPQASLAVLSSMGTVNDDLRRSIVDNDLLNSVDSLATARSEDPYATRAHVRLDGPTPGLRFQKLREHAAGNLGVVFIARDEELNREVALKEIKKNADLPHNQAKFLLEAEVTGGLEHPGIVPVYGLGHHDDGRPFYAMRFIRGKSLLDAIKRFHADESLKSDPGQRLLALQKLIRRFTDVCNAIAYAHSRGVLHRDLKPANVMVGKYGETLVVDWGLAKPIGRAVDPVGTLNDPEDPLPEASFQPTRSNDLQDTQAGSIIGTPAYMSPEQAAGRLDLLGPASDIYGLGATLYHLVVGRPPIEASSIADLLAKIQNGAITRPRSLTPWLDPALEAICLKAMALQPESRYATPRALAEDLDRWIAGEPVAAYPEPWLRRARRWAGKNRTALATAGSAATVALVLLGMVAWQEAARREEIDSLASSSLGRAEVLAGEARKSGDLALWEKAIAETLLARERLESGGSIARLGEVVGRLEAFRAERDARRNDRQVVDSLEEAKLLGANDKNGEFDYEAQSAGYLKAFRTYGIDLETMPIEEAARKIRSSKVADDLLFVLDNWPHKHVGKLSIERRIAITRGAETDPVRSTIRELIVKRDVIGLREMISRPEDRAKMSPRLRMLLEALYILDPNASLPLLETFRRENPTDFWANHNLGAAYDLANPPQPLEAIRWFSVAVALRPNSLGARTNLGLTLLAQGKFDQATECFREAIRINPRDADSQCNLADALYRLGQIDEAIEKYRFVFQLDPNHLRAHENLAGILRDRGKPDEAIAECREAVRLNPNDPEAHGNLGAALVAKGDHDAAIAEYRVAIRLKPDYDKAHANLGNSLQQKNDLDGAIAEFQQAILINPNLFEAHRQLGSALQAKGDLDGAIDAVKEAIRIQPENAQSHGDLGAMLYARRDLAGAIAECQKSIQLKADDPEPHSNLGAALADQGKIERAIAEYYIAIRLNPKIAKVHYNLANALTAKQNLEGAAAEFQAAIQVDPNFAEAHGNLANLLQGLGDIDRAIAEYRTALRIRPSYSKAHANLAVALASQRNFDASIAEFETAIQLNPEDAISMCNLGQILKDLGRHADALTQLERGHQLGSRRSDWRMPSAQWISECRHLLELEAKLPSVLKGEVSPKDAEERRVLAELTLKQKNYGSAVRLFNAAFAENPGLAENLQTGSRYNAACSAILAGSGQSKDEPPPDPADQAKLRQQALGWLKADLDLWAKILEGGDEPARKQFVAKKLAHWKQDSDLAGIRAEAGLAKLPDAEQQAFRALWSEVDSLLKKAAVGP